MLPDMRYRDGIRKEQQVRFEGLNRRLGAPEGAIMDMRNLTSDHYPVLSVRAPREFYEVLEDQGWGISSFDELCWVDGTNLIYNGVPIGKVSEGEKVFACMGSRIFVFPDKVYFDARGDVFGSMEQSWTGENVTFGSCEIYGTEAKANMLQCQGVDWRRLFRPGDAVNIEGCKKHLNNKTSIIREINGDKLVFSENTFTLDAGDTAYTEPDAISVSRRVPDLKFVFENENRLWGCTDREIYCSKLGDGFNWSVYDGLDSDAWQWSPGSAGNFTAAISYRGYPTFFKEDKVYKIYGCVASDFQCVSTSTLGVREGAGSSLAIVNDILYYFARSGFMAYTGGISQPIGLELGDYRERISAVAGTDGIKYYACLYGIGVCWLYVYDPRFDTWHIEDNLEVHGFARKGSFLYALCSNYLGSGGEDTGGKILILNGAWPNEPDYEWRAVFGKFVDDSPNKKGLSKLQIRTEMPEGSSMTVALRFDSSDELVPVGTIRGEGVMKSYYLSVVPRRCDHYSIELSGVGDCKVYSIARERYGGSELNSIMGRN